MVSLLFSPGMLPAERPSHLYLNLIPLCLGCSMISMKALDVWTDGQVEDRHKIKMWLKTETLALNHWLTKVLECLLMKSSTVNILTHSCVIFEGNNSYLG